MLDTLIWFVWSLPPLMTVDVPFWSLITTLLPMYVNASAVSASEPDESALLTTMPMRSDCILSSAWDA